MKWKLEEAFHRLDKHAQEEVSTFLIQNRAAFLYLSATQEQKLTDVFYFLREENFVHFEPIEDRSRRGLQAHRVVEAIPLPRLLRVWEDIETQ